MKTYMAIPLMLFALLASFAACGDSRVGQPTLDFTAEDLEGNRISLSDYRGKVVLLDFWATWCGPCLAELPHVREVYGKHKDSGFEVIGISLDIDPVALGDFVQKQGITWPQVFDRKGWDSEVAALYKVDAIPTTFLIDREGIIRYIDPMGRDLERAVKALLDAAVKG